MRVFINIFLLKSIQKLLLVLIPSVLISACMSNPVLDMKNRYQYGMSLNDGAKIMAERDAYYTKRGYSTSDLEKLEKYRNSSNESAKIRSKFKMGSYDYVLANSQVEIYEYKIQHIIKKYAKPSEMKSIDRIIDRISQSLKMDTEKLPSLKKEKKRKQRLAEKRRKELLAEKEKKRLAEISAKEERLAKESSTDWGEVIISGLVVATGIGTLAYGAAKVRGDSAKSARNLRRFECKRKCIREANDNMDKECGNPSSGFIETLKKAGSNVTASCSARDSKEMQEVFSTQCHSYCYN